MRLFVLSIVLAVSSCGTAVFAETREEYVVTPIRVQMDNVPYAALVTMLMRDVLRVPYTLAPEILGDTRPLSVNLLIPREHVTSVVLEYLRSIGLRVVQRSGTVFVSKTGMAEGGISVPIGSPLSPATASDFGVSAPVPALQNSLAEISEEQPSIEDLDLLIVRLAHRDPDEVAQLLEPLFPSITIAARGDVAANNDRTAVLGSLGPDRLVVAGESAILDRVEKLVRVIDKPRPVVSVRGVVLQVSDTATSANALSLLTNVLGGRLEASLNGSVGPSENFVKLSVGGLTGILTALKGDGRFRVVAEPALTVVSGGVGTLNSGSQVPTLGAVSYAEGGQMVRSVVYRDSGVSLTVRPVVRGGEIALSVDQERSSFARTGSGVDDSPTLNRAASSGSFALVDGETIAFASLDERLDSDSRTGVLGGLFRAKQSDRSRSQLLVVFEASVIADARAGEPSFERIAQDNADDI